MSRAWNFRGFLEGCDRDFGTFILRDITETTDGELVCKIKTTFMRKLYDEEELECGFFASWNPEFGVLKFLYRINTQIHANWYGQVLEFLNTNTPELPLALAATIEVPFEDNEDLQIQLACRWSLAFNPAVFGRPLTKVALQTLIQKNLTRLCAESIQLYMELMKAISSYSEH